MVSPCLSISFILFMIIESSQNVLSIVAYGGSEFYNLSLRCLRAQLP